MIAIANNHQHDNILLAVAIDWNYQASCASSSLWGPPLFCSGQFGSSLLLLTSQREFAGAPGQLDHEGAPTVKDPSKIRGKPTNK